MIKTHMVDSKNPFLWMVLFVLASCSKVEEAGKGGKGNQPVAVSVIQVVRKNVPLTLQAMGNAESCHTVAVKSRVDGEIIRSHITDGQEISQGHPLFDLDSRPFQYRLNQLKANLQRDLALLDNAKAKEQRQVILRKEKIASEENTSSLVSGRQAAEATVAADRAAIAEGELQLAFTHIISPISGMVGRILIQAGNLVKANDTNPLVVINQVDPMCITFTVAEQHLPIIRESHARSPLTLQVFASKGADDPPISATLLSLDHAIDRQTASLRLKAIADNPTRRLWPGMFVTLAMKLADRPDALVIPVQAVQSSMKGTFAYVVKPDKIVEQRFLTIAQENKEESVIANGVDEGEWVVTVGQWRLKPGALVEIPQAKEEAKK